MNLPNSAYDTIIESTYVREFLQKHKTILNLSNLSRKCGMDRTKLVRIGCGSKETIHPKQLQILSKIFQELNFQLPQKTITIEYIQQKVSRISGVTLEEMRLKYRKRGITEERQITMYLTKKLIPGMTQQAIGEYFYTGKSDVCTSIKTIKNIMQVNILLRKKVEDYLKIFE